MKKLFYTAMCLVIVVASSCSKVDNYAPPSSTLSGSTIDAGTGETVQTEIGGGGTRVKLIEAAGFGRPIVATPLAAEGLSLEHGRDILLFQADSDLAAACVALLENDDEARALGQSARRKAQSLYSFDQTRDQIADELRNWFANKRGRSDGAAFMGFKPKAHRVETGSDCPSVPSSLEQR